MYDNKSMHSRLHLGMLIHKTNLVQVIHLMEGFRKAILKSSCSAMRPLNTQEKSSGGTLTHLPPLFYAGKTSTERLGLSTAPVPVYYTDLPNIELLGLFLSPHLNYETSHICCQMKILDT